jgi:glycosyltransferase involved in cell wall biosynthesis
MKLVIATPLYPPEPGGPATYVKLLEEGLPAEGIEIAVVKFSDVRGWPKLFRHVLYERKVARALQDADAVLALDPVSTGLPSLSAAKKEKKPFFVKIVGDYAWEQGTQRFGITVPLDEFVKIPSEKLPLPVRLLRRIQEHVASMAKQVIVPSPYLKGIIEAWGISPDSISIIHNAVEVPRERTTEETPEGEFRIVSSGREVPWKGFETLRRLAAARASDGWRADIVSGVSREEALARVRAGDVFVLNSSYEGFPHALVEAMALGTPVIATDITPHRYLIENGVTGILVPVGDDDALLGALKEIRKNPGIAKERAQRAKTRAEEFAPEALLRQTAHFFTTQI